MTRYELLDRIGIGGMAEIFRGKAVAAGGFEKPVAIKRILPHLSQDKRFVELLIAEAKVLSLLKHRNIVQIFDVGLGDDGQYFLVMEYVDGKDLGAVQRGNETKRKRMAFDLALHVGAEICEALEHAHSARAPDGKPMSLVHRDLSPSNVLLSRAGEVKLTDFGIAKRAESEQTGTGGVRGKFAYISPEQARNEHVEPRSDVFSVAILLWELVTGQRLFSGMADLEALRRVREAVVQRPTAADPKLPDAIDTLLLGALDRDPRRRPTAGQFGEQLRSLRYSLETSGGDPATQLAQMIDEAEELERASSDMIPLPPRIPAGRVPAGARPHTGRFEPEVGEATVIRIRTAAEFAILDASQSMSAARQVIDRFEEEETRLAQLSGDQMRLLRGTDDIDEAIAPPRRSRNPTDEPTSMHSPVMAASSDDDDAFARASPLPHDHFQADEATRIVAPVSRRTPAPERVKRAATAPPPLPGLTPRRGPPPLPGVAPAPEPPPPPPPSVEDYVPGTVHSRSPTVVPMPLGGPAPMVQPPPPAYAPPLQQPMQMHQPMPHAPPMQHAPPMPHTPMQNPPINPAMNRMSVPQMQAPMYPPNSFAPPPPQQSGGLQPWMLVVGAILMAALAFILTRLLIRG